MAVFASLRCMGGMMLGLSLAPFVVGCNRPTSDNIQLWKTTQKGPERLHDTLTDRGVAPRLRGEAAVALIDIGHTEEVDQTFAKMPVDDRAEISKTVEPAYEVAMKDPAPEKALAYRDALFALRQYGNPDEQKRIDDALMPVLEASLRSGKLHQGRHSVEKMLTTMGRDASSMLTRVLSEPNTPFVQSAELLAKVGDESARDAGSAALIARAPQILGKENKHPETFYKALGTLGGPSAIKFLEAKVTGKDKDEAVMATQALGERRDPAVLPFALKVAADSRADKGLRDQMFGVIEGIGGLEAEKGLLGIISSDRDEIVRYRAFESVLAARKAEGIQPGLEAFPASAAYKRVDVDDLMVKLIEKLGGTARPALVTTLGSRVPLARMTAVMALEQMGRAPDAPALEKLTGDGAAIKGFPPGETIGKAAARAAEVVRKKS
jgi:HEAT repeat protein